MVVTVTRFSTIMWGPHAALYAVERREVISLEGVGSPDYRSGRGWVWQVGTQLFSVV